MSSEKATPLNDDSTAADGASPDDLRLDAYDYHLPPELIAQEPAAERTDSRLLVFDRRRSWRSHRHFRDLPDLLSPGDCLVFNDTRVVPGRTHGLRTRTGGKCEVLFLEDRGDGTWTTLLGTRGKPEIDETFDLLDGRLSVRLLERIDRGVVRVEPS